VLCWGGANKDLFVYFILLLVFTDRCRCPWFMFHVRGVGSLEACRLDF